MYVEGSRTLSAMYQQGRGAFISEFEPPDQIVRKVSSGREYPEISRTWGRELYDLYYGRGLSRVGSAENNREKGGRNDRKGDVAIGRRRM